jgi:hypothetical protein
MPHSFPEVWKEKSRGRKKIRLGVFLAESSVRSKDAPFHPARLFRSVRSVLSKCLICRFRWKSGCVSSSYTVWEKKLKQPQPSLNTIVFSWRL